jgi:hypothetical protein
MKTKTKKMENTKKQCGLCQAEFQVRLDNENLSDERKEKIGEKLSSYCPACSIAEWKNK